MKVPAGHHVERKARKGLLITGISLLGAGWLLSVLVSIGGGTYALLFPSNTCWAFAASTGWVPLVGPAIAIAGQSNPSLKTDGGKQCTRDSTYQVGFVIAAADTVMQWAGLTMMVLGLVLRTEVVVPDAEAAASAPSKPHLFFSLGSSASPLGMTVGVTGW